MAEPQTQKSGVVLKDVRTGPGGEPVYYLLSGEKTFSMGAGEGSCNTGCYDVVNLKDGSVNRYDATTILATEYWNNKKKNFQPVTGEEAINVLKAFIGSELNKKPGNYFGSSQIITEKDITQDGKVCSKERFYIKNSDFPPCITRGGRTRKGKSRKGRKSRKGKSRKGRKSRSRK